MLSFITFFESLDDWNKSSVKHFGRTIGKSPEGEGFFSKCQKRMENKPGFTKENSAGFCAKLIDKAKGTTKWRTGPDGEHKK